MIRYTIVAALLFYVPCVTRLQADEASLVVDLGEGSAIDFVRIPQGELQQGSPDSEAGREPDEVIRKVVLSRDFFLATTPVTVGQFRRFVSETNYRTDAETGPSGGFGVVEGKLVQQPQFNWKNPGYEQTDAHPVTIVTFADAQAFLKWLSLKSGRQMVLPTEAQWEYACRAESSSRYYSGDEDSVLDDIGWSQRTSPSGPMPVRQKQPNAFGLFDMSGNVYEWCEDIYGIYTSETVSDPLEKAGQPGEKERNVLRGGSWMRAAKRCRSAARYRATPGTRNAENGFRVATHDTGKSPAVAASTAGTSAPGSAAALSVPDGDTGSSAETAMPSPSGMTPSEVLTADPVNAAPPAEHQPGTPIAAPRSMLGTLFFLGFGLIVVMMLVVFLMNFLRSDTDARNSAVVGEPVRNFSPSTSSSRRPAGEFAGVSGGVLSVENDGFWLSTQTFPIGTMLECEYWSGGKLFSETIEVTSSERQFVYTGTAPTMIEVRVSGSVTRPGMRESVYPTETWHPETETAVPPLPPAVYVTGTAFETEASDSQQNQLSSRPSADPGSVSEFPPAY